MLFRSTLLSSQVATGISWSPLSGLKGVKPPVKFGEKTRLGLQSHNWATEQQQQFQDEFILRFFLTLGLQTLLFQIRSHSQILGTGHGHIFLGATIQPITLVLKEVSTVVLSAEMKYGIWKHLRK